MATGNSIIPLGSEKLNDAGEWLIDQGIFFPETLRHGRYPSQNELRRAIDALGFEIEESGDWYVTSKNDFTEIWFSGDPGQGDQPVEFWCRRGEIIALDIGQGITNLCGSLVVIHHSDGIPVLLVPDDAFPAIPSKRDQEGFFATIAHRAPTLIENLPAASPPDTLFILSQLRQALRKARPPEQYELLEAMKRGLPTCSSLLAHPDTRVRCLAFELITLFREGTFERLESLSLSIANEPDSNTKTRMVNAMENLIVSGSIGADISQPVRRVLDVLHELSEHTGEAPSVQLAAVNLLAQAQHGLLTPAMRVVLIDAMTNPDRFAVRWNLSSNVFDQALKTLDQLLLSHRIEILMRALPDINVAEDAHHAARALLDHAFFGEIRPTQMSSLPDSAVAERVAIDQGKFRSRGHPFTANWLYPANPTRITAQDLLSIQRDVLQAVINLDLPWMVHSNLLEKYGLPPTRALVRVLLQGDSS